MAIPKERGATAMIVAGSLMLLMGMAAIAIDLGAGFNSRRGNQTAADTAAMAGALSFGDPTSAVDQALSVARLNLEVTYSDAEWQSIWNTCTDAGRTAGFFPVTSAWGSDLDCISQSANEFRVRVPDQLTGTSFAQVWGIDEVTTNAAAVATIRPRSAGTGLLPFVIPGGQSAGELCMQTSSGGQAVDPCDGPDRGSFGALLSPQFGNAEMGTSVDCSTSGLNHNLDDSIARGVDHFIGVYATTGWSYPQTGSVPSDNSLRNSPGIHEDECSVIGGVAVADGGVPINTVRVGTGNIASEVKQGLATGSGYTPRLRQNSGTIRTLRDGTSSVTLNDVPLWDYLLPGAGATVSSCNPGNFSGTVHENTDQMAQCLDDHESAGAGQIFSDSIAASPRFAWAPQLWFTTTGSGSKLVPVRDFRIVYLHSIYMNCSGSGGGNGGNGGNGNGNGNGGNGNGNGGGSSTPCVEFIPGDSDTSDICDPTGSGCKNLAFNQTTAFMLYDGAVSASIVNAVAGSSELGPFEPELLH